MPRLPFSRHTRRSAGIVVSLGLYALLIAAAAVIVLWVLVRALDPPTPPPDRLATVEELVAQFDQLVFEGHQNARVRKWIHPIRIAVYGEDAEKWRPFLEEYAARLSSLLDLSVKVLDPSEGRANLYLHLVGHDQVYDLGTSYDYRTRTEVFEYFAKNEHGMTILIPRNAKKIAVAAVILTTDHGDEYLSMAIRHDLVHALGMMNHSELILPSLMGGTYYYVGLSINDLSINDTLVLRALYDYRIKPDTWRGEVLPLAREIIAELVEEARAQEAAMAD